MKKVLAAYLAALLIAFCSPAGAFLKHGGIAPVNPSIPTLVAGSLAPSSQTPTMPSASTWGPSCGGSGNAGLDAAWGPSSGPGSATGCNTTTQLCNAPTALVPLQTCQLPQMFVVTGGSGNGTTATITYTSYAHYTFPAATPMIVSVAAQTNWNTPALKVNAFTGGAGSCAPTCTVVLGFIPLSGSPVPFATGQTVYVGQVTGNGSTSAPGFGWTNGNPNGVWSVQSATATSVTFSTGSTQVTGTLSGLNDLSYNGTVQAPWVVGSSICNIGGTPEHCSVTFPNSNTCASSCVSAATQIVAGQNDDVIMAWHYGEDMQNSVQNGDVLTCAMAKHISPIQFVQFSLDGGAWTSVTAPVVNPWGAGKSTLTEPATKYSYCAHFAASAVSDGLHEIRAIACPTAGYCGQLSSVITADGNTGSTYFKSNNHALPAWKNVGITKSFDPAFQNYNWQYYTPGIAITSSTSSGTGLSTNSVTYGFTQPTNYPLFQPNQTVNIAGVTPGSNCAITGATATGAALILNFSASSSCNFPVGSSVNIASTTVAPASITSGSYNSTTGVISLVFNTPPNGTAPTTGINANPYVNEYNLTLTGTGVIASLNGAHQLISTSGTGPITYNFQDSASLSLTITGGTIAGNGTVGATPITWNTVNTVGAIVSASSSTSITLPSISTATWAAGGTITANWNSNCTIPASYTPASGSITCPAPFSAATSGTGGTITATGNVYCTVGGSGDWFPPFDPAAIGQQVGQLNPGSFQLIPLAPNSCITINANQNDTGCTFSPCGVTPTQAETLWFTRKDSGADERANAQVTMNVNGSLWVTTNAGQAIKAQNAYTNAWKQTAGGLGCLSAVIPAGTSVAYTGNYCSDMKSAFFGLAPTANGLTQSLANSGGCLTFTQAQNQGATPFYVGEPVEWTGLDKNASPSLSMWGVYWVQSLTGAAPSGAITLATTPTGACINDTAANITTSALFKDVGMDSLLLACDTTTTVPCSNANPETYLVGTSNSLTVPTLYAKSGYLNISPDTNAGSTFPATSHQVSLLNGAGGISFGAGAAQGGRIRVTADSIQTQLSLTTVVSIPKTPPITTIAGGTASGTTEILNFATLSGVAWQVAGTGSPGQGIIVSGVSPADGNCGTAAIPCHITSATSTSITFTNPGATSTTYVAGGKIVPASIILQLAPGTFAYNAANTPPSGCASNNVSVNTGSAIACLAQYGASRTASGTNSTAWPFYSSAGGQITNLALSSNCLPVGSAQQPGLVFQTTPLNIIPGAISGGNDILELTWGGVAGQNASFQAYNNCGTGPFFFANTGAVLTGFQTHVATDVWEDGRDVTGPYWANTFLGGQGTLNGGLTGASYLTNSHRYNTHTASDHESYAWGTNSEYNLGICLNSPEIVVDVRCIGSQEAVPFSLGGGNTTGAVYGQFWIPLTANVTSGNTVFSVAQGALPANLTPGWGGYIICNFANPLTAASASITSVGGAVITAYDNSTSPATITFASAATSNCTTGQNPVLLLYNIVHIDMIFYLLNAAAPPMFGPIGNVQGPWNYYNNGIVENISCPGCVNMQGIVFGGGSYYDIAFDDDDVEVWGNPVPSQQFSIQSFTPVNPYLMQNFIVRNTNLWGRVSFPTDPFTTDQTFTDIYTINDSGGAFQLGFPVVGQYNALYGGFGGMSNGQHLAIGGSEQATVWPTLTAGVDGSGVPNTPSTPHSGSMSACPWYCTATDTGLGSM